MAMTFGIHVGHLGGPMAELSRLWRFADERGFDWFSVSDHFQESPPQGGDLDCFEAVATMAAAAATVMVDTASRQSRSPPWGGDSWKWSETENQSKPLASANFHSLRISPIGPPM